MPRTLPHNARLLLLVTLMVLTACSAKFDLRETEQNAAARLAAKDYAGAVVQIKEAFGRGGDASPRLRMLLGQALYEEGQYPLAEIEFQKAKELGYSSEDLQPALAKCFLALGKDKRVIEDFGKLTLKDHQLDSILKGTVATAQARSGDQNGAAASIAAALESDSKNIDAKILSARLVAGEKNFPAALTKADEIVAQAPEYAPSYKLRGDIRLFGTADLKGATADYLQSLKLKSKQIDTHAALIAIAIYQRDAKLASTYLSEMKAAFPNAAETLFADAQIAFLTGDYAKTQTIVQTLMKVAPDNEKLLQLAGSNAMLTKAYAAAEAHFGRALAINANLHTTRKLLGELYLKRGRPEKALAVLQPILNLKVNDPETLMLVAEANMSLGFSTAAEQAYALALRAKPDDVRIRTAHALAQSVLGDQQSAVNELIAISKTDPGVVADLALINTRIRAKEYDKALAALDSLERKEPANPRSDSIRGNILILQDKVDLAKKAYESALSKDSGHQSSILKLAAIDERFGNKNDALKRLLRFSEKNSATPEVKVATADLKAKLGATKDDVVKELDAGVAADKRDPMPRIAKISYLRKQQDIKAALATAVDAVSAIPDSPELLDALGYSQIGAGEFNQAATTYGKLLILNPKSVLPYMRLADISLAKNDTPAAIRELERAAAASPMNLDVRYGLISLYVKTGSIERALTVARQVQDNFPASAAGFALEGDIFLETKKDLPLAVNAYRKGLDRKEVGQLPIKLHKALARQAEPREAQIFAETWQKKHPDDTAFIYHLAESALAAKAYPEAEAFYRSVYQREPSNYLAMNNAAWAMVQAGRPGAAALAVKAAGLAPNSGPILDTLASALLAEGDLKGSIAATERAVRSNPLHPAYKLNLANLYVIAKNKDAARAILDDLRKMPDGKRPDKEITTLEASIKGIKD